MGRGQLSYSPDTHNVKILSGIALPTQWNSLARLDHPLDQVSPPSDRPAGECSCFCLRVLTYTLSSNTHRTKCLLLKEEHGRADGVRVFRRIGYILVHFFETQEPRDQQMTPPN